MSAVDLLQPLRQHGPPAATVGLADDVIERFAANDKTLGKAIADANTTFSNVVAQHADVLAMTEEDQVNHVQKSLLNFYPDDQVNPYVTLTACGPWLVTLKGAVLHDSGGYGMIGLGHAPTSILQAMNQEQAMANVMTPNLSQLAFFDLLESEIGRSSSQPCPFSQFIALNSGSESVAMAARLSDINAKQNTDPGGQHQNQPIKMVALEGAFHGRTQRPALASHSTQAVYNAHLASFRDRDHLITVPPNDVEALNAVFTTAQKEQYFIEAVFMEPVMGEGNPGLAIGREFYDRARQLTLEHNALLLIDSIQAGLRVHGVLSIVDYPGFENAIAPDMETYSKALNA
ncbi:MAG: aminotransferase class III-fold pyridoxal phosphate-dependent enzyme, partial [Gammaproteobacteria bacterium]|nr:aminotransferase class III-fold pyridoxal phosphate-dependent enzyme [Gammaproteobacteria bacterium]